MPESNSEFCYEIQILFKTLCFVIYKTVIFLEDNDASIKSTYEKSISRFMIHVWARQMIASVPYQFSPSITK